MSRHSDQAVAGQGLIVKVICTYLYDSFFQFRTLFLTSEWPGSVRKTLSLPCQALVQTRGMGFWKEFVKNVREEVKKSDIKSTEDIKLLSEGAKRVSTGLSKVRERCESV